MTPVAAASLGGVALALAVTLGTVVARLVRPGSLRRGCEEGALLLGFAAPALALLGGRLQHRLWAGAAVIAFAYGGFYLVRMRQLRRADRDAARRLLGLGKDATFGEAAGEALRIDPKPVTTAGRVTLGLAAAAVVTTGYLLGHVDTAMIGLGLGVAESTARPAYHRALARRVREIGH